MGSLTKTFPHNITRMRPQDSGVAGGFIFPAPVVRYQLKTFPIIFFVRDRSVVRGQQGAEEFKFPAPYWSSRGKGRYGAVDAWGVLIIP